MGIQSSGYDPDIDGLRITDTNGKSITVTKSDVSLSVSETFLKNSMKTLIGTLDDDHFKYMDIHIYDKAEGEMAVALSTHPIDEKWWARNQKEYES